MGASVSHRSFKVKPHHLSREACIYVRQSSPHQVLNHTESAYRQYQLRERAVALGWPAGCIRTIDEDQGKSGGDSTNRDGYRMLVAAVANGDVGIVLCLEISRLARNEHDFHTLLHLAALNDTLILDEAGVYDPNDSDDKLVLGFKSTISAYELDTIKARLIGGQRSKAMRGELRLLLPVGLVYDPDGKVVLDPDRRVFDAIDLVFKTFRRQGTCMHTVRWFRSKNIKIPSLQVQDGKRVLRWTLPNHAALLKKLHNPRYAGCYSYGRFRIVRGPNGAERRKKLPHDQWMVCLPDAHPGYIKWEDYLQNQKTLEANGRAFEPSGARRNPPRNGRALLQSRVMCGRCGKSMNTVWSGARPKRKEKASCRYICRAAVLRNGSKTCQSVLVGPVDAAVADFVVRAVNLKNISLMQAVQQELLDDFEKADQQRANQIAALQAEFRKRRERYDAVDPHYRPLAAVFEAELNDCLLRIEAAVEERDRYAAATKAKMSEAQTRRIKELAEDFGKVWNAPDTRTVDRKRLLGEIVETATLTRKDTQVRIDLRLHGGKLVRLDDVQLPLPITCIRITPAETISATRELRATGLDDRAIAVRLNELGLAGWDGKPMTSMSVSALRRRLGMPNILESRRRELEELGWSRGKDIARRLGMDPETLRKRSLSGDLVERKLIPLGKRHFVMYRQLPDKPSNQRPNGPESQ